MFSLQQNWRRGQNREKKFCLEVKGVEGKGNRWRIGDRGQGERWP
jgi:hypothetical protein